MKLRNNSGKCGKGVNVKRVGGVGRLRMSGRQIPSLTVHTGYSRAGSRPAGFAGRAWSPIGPTWPGGRSAAVRRQPSP